MSEFKSQAGQSRSLLFCALGLFGAAPVAAQTSTLAGEASVTSRAHPDYDAIGFQVGSFTAFPQLSVDVGYNNNLYNRSSPKDSDGFVEIAPQVSIRSNWSSNSLGIDLTSRIDRYFKTGTENTEQYGANAHGSLDISRVFHITATGGYQRADEPRGTSGDIFTTGDPIQYNLLHGGITASNQFGRITTSIGGSIAKYTYKPVDVNGQVVSLNYRDYRTLEGTARIGYEISPRLETFVSGSYNSGLYTDPAADSINRNSHGYQVLGGVAFGFTELLFAQIGVGYLSQNYRNPIFSDSHGITYSASLHWNPTLLMSVSASANRTVGGGQLIGVASVIQSGGNVQVDYELLRNLILKLSGIYNTSSFTGEDRRDHLFSGTFGAKYLVNHLLDATLNYTYRKQASVGTFARRYDGSTITAGITLHR